MRSTKAMAVPGGVVMQTSTLQRNEVAGKMYSVAESLVFVPKAVISDGRREDGTYRLEPVKRGPAPKKTV